MGVGDLTVTIVGTYNTLALAVAAWDAGVDTTPATDSHQIIISPVQGSGLPSFTLIKILKATA